jgi:hypothetical protein
MAVCAAAVRDADERDGCNGVREGEVEWVEQVAKHARQPDNRGS